MSTDTILIIGQWTLLLLGIILLYLDGDYIPLLTGSLILGFMSFNVRTLNQERKTT